jgi:hypothetical protein
VIQQATEAAVGLPGLIVLALWLFRDRNCGTSSGLVPPDHASHQVTFNQHHAAVERASVTDHDTAPVVTFTTVSCKGRALGNRLQRSRIHVYLTRVHGLVKNRRLLYKIAAQFSRRA